jgi:leucyl-tRNA---protein transferase
MLDHYYQPTSYNPKWVDEVLALGWFRMGQVVHTNKFVTFYNKVYRTVWLRHCLQNYTETKTILNLKKRNKHFTVELKQFDAQEKHHALFEQYKNAMPFKVSNSIPDLLFCFAKSDTDVFNTYQLCLYDGDKLIGCSYFDIGHKSAEGISAFYDVNYTQHSLGKYLIYLQIEICKTNNLEYYYPGYFVPSYTHLDYKLNIATHCLEYFNNDMQQWLPIQDYLPEAIPIELGAYFDNE